MAEVVCTFVWADEIADIADGFEQDIEGSGTDRSAVGLEFGKCHFDA
jgi:hypothetical protein